MKKFKFKINGSDYEVSVNEVEKYVAEIEVNGTPFTVEIERQEKTSVSTVDRKPAGKVNPIATPARTVQALALKAPLPGNIMKVLVAPGQAVKRGDLLLTMESMKMENNILAEQDGIVKTVHVKPGQNVMQDDVLIDFEGADSTGSAAQAESAAPAQHASKPAGPVVKIKSPLPGSILKVAISNGQEVKRGDLLLTLESMKMENAIHAEKDGVIKNIHVKAGQSVMQDDLLIEME